MTSKEAPPAGEADREAHDQRHSGEADDCQLHVLLVYSRHGCIGRSFVREMRRPMRRREESDDYELTTQGRCARSDGDFDDAIVERMKLEAAL